MNKIRLHKFDKLFTYSWIFFLSSVSILYLFHGVSNLLEGQNLPVDLALRYWQSKELILDKLNIYSQSVHAQYPPSFYFFLYPFLHLFPYQLTDVSWLFLSIGLLISATSSLYLIEKLFNGKVTWFLPLSFLCFHSIAHGLGVGQVHLITPIGILIYIVLSSYEKRSLSSNLLALVFLTFSLGKLSLSIPFAIVLLLENEHRRNVIIAITLNIFISWIVLLRIGSSPIEYIYYLATNSGSVSTLGHLDVQFLAHTLSLPSYSGLIIGIFLILVLIILSRKSSLTIWDKLALSAITARFFIYHAHYDNTILVFLVIASYRRISSCSLTSKHGILFCLLVVSLIIPARFLEWSYPYYGITLVFQLSIWLYSTYYLITNNIESLEV